MDKIAAAYKAMITESSNHPMVMLDGKLRHLNNSMGQQIHPTLDGVYNFHRWFKDSKAVDEHGRPKVFYHGTGADIPAFSHDFVGKGTDAHGSGFYFTDSPDVASHYAANANDTKNVLPVYLRLRKPIHTDSEKELSHNHIRDLIVNAPNHKDSLSNFGDADHIGYHRVLNDAVDAYKGLIKRNAIFSIGNDFYSGHASTFLKHIERFTRHDGVVHTSNGARVVAMFNPKNIKSAIGNDGTFDHPANINESKGMDPIKEAYNQMRSISQESPEDKDYNERLSKIWRDTAAKPWSEYAAGMNLGGQEIDSPENEASKQRVRDYIEKHKHLFMQKNVYQR